MPLYFAVGLAGTREMSPNRLSTATRGDRGEGADGSRTATMTTTPAPRGAVARVGAGTQTIERPKAPRNAGIPRSRRWSSSAPPESVSILGVPVTRLTAADALREVERLCDRDELQHVAYVNAHSCNLAVRDPDYRAFLREADLVLNDGIGLAIAARVHGTRFPTNLNGSDFTPEILRVAARRNLSVFLLGAGEHVVHSAAKSLRERIPGLRIAGVRDGYFPDEQSADVAEEIRRSRADVLIVAMGNPKQELWMAEYGPLTGVRLAVGVGAFLDFVSGAVPRAPRWMNAMGIEWIYRFVQEPRRLWRRYVIGNPVFLARILRERAVLRRRP